MEEDSKTKGIVQAPANNSNTEKMYAILRNIRVRPVNAATDFMIPPFSY